MPKIIGFICLYFNMPIILGLSCKPLRMSEVLEYVPESIKVIRHVRPIARSYAGPGLLAHVLVAKFSDHTPLHRQSEIYAREGVALDRSTLAGWVGASSALLAPLVDAPRDHVLAASKLHADDTPVPVLAPGNGRTKTGRLWTYVRDGRPCGDTAPPAAWFAFSSDRRGEHPQGHLKSFRGTLQADAYAGFHPVYGSSQSVGPFQPEIKVPRGPPCEGPRGTQERRPPHSTQCAVTLTVADFAAA